MAWHPHTLTRSTGWPEPRRLPRRLVKLYAGLVLYGITMGLLVRAQLGVILGDVLLRGLSRQFGVSMGKAVLVLVRRTVARRRYSTRWRSARLSRSCCLG